MPKWGKAIISNLLSTCTPPTICTIACSSYRSTSEKHHVALRNYVDRCSLSHDKTTRRPVYDYPPLVHPTANQNDFLLATMEDIAIQLLGC